MRQRSTAAASAPRARRVAVSVDVALFTPRARGLALLLVRGTGAGETGGRERWMLPWDDLGDGQTLEGAAQRIARATAGAEPSWLQQVGAFADAKRHPGERELSVAFVGVLPAGTAPAERKGGGRAGPAGGAGGGERALWFSTQELPPLPPRHRVIVESALAALRAGTRETPVAFRLLPAAFTLSELQHVYELLLGRPLHKASFRRALHAAGVLEPTDQWRSEGRGRPAQLFRYHPRRHEQPRGMRFDFGG